MAFHARSHRPTHEKGSSRSESILGLAGWLFADLLLALSVVFLVAQDRPGGTDLASLQRKLDESNAKIVELEKENKSLKDDLAELQALCDLNNKICGGKSGLISTEQLIITVNRGAAGRLTQGEMKASIDSAGLEIENTRTSKRTRTSWNALLAKHRRIGLVMFFTKDDVQTQKRARGNLGLVVQAFVEKKIVDVDQLEKNADGSLQFGNFPILPVYKDDLVQGNDLKIRALMFTNIPRTSNP